MKTVKQIYRFFRLVISRFRADGCTTRASALAFATLLSIVPLLTVSFSLLTAFPVFQVFALKIQNFVFDNFVPTSAAVLQQYLQDIVRQTSKLSAISMCFLIATAVLMVFNMEQAFNTIWHAKKQRGFLSAFLMYWAVLTLAPILIGIGLVISTYIISLPLISVAANLLGLKKLLFYTTPYLSTLVAFTLLYLAVPNRKVLFRYALAGGAVATLLFELAKEGFVFYITRFSIYKLVYGALATIPIFLVWIYLSWLIILFGAVVSATLEERFEKTPPR